MFNKEKPWILPAIDVSTISKMACRCCTNGFQRLCLSQELFGENGLGFSCHRNDSDRTTVIELNGMTLAELEKTIEDDDMSEYRIVYLGGLHDETYQRHDRNVWVLINQGPGFA